MVGENLQKHFESSDDQWFGGFAECWLTSGYDVELFNVTPSSFHT